MKNRIINIMMFGLLLSIKSNALKLPMDSIECRDLINIQIVQSEKQEHVVKLYVQNPQMDTVIIRSSFYLDNIDYASYILVYCCIPINKDSVYCMWDSTEEFDPTRVEYGDRWLYIPPGQIIYMEVPIRRDYIEYDIYFKVRFLLLYKGISSLYIKESNKIHIERYEKREGSEKKRVQYNK